jgi:hypothetical protein
LFFLENFNSGETLNFLLKTAFREYKNNYERQLIWTILVFAGAYIIIFKDD